MTAEHMKKARAVLGRVAGPIFRRGRPRMHLSSSDAGFSVYDVRVGRVHLQLGEPANASGLGIIVKELDRGPYDFSDIDFRPGDVVIDLGAHVGAVSTFLGKKFPYLRIFAFEPVPPLFDSLRRNIARNDLANVTAVNEAVTGDGRSLELVSYLGANSGGSTANVPAGAYLGSERFTVSSTTLDEIFSRYGIQRCRLLKIDVEGSEHEILTSSNSLDRIDYLRGEFHENAHLARQGYGIDELLAYCARFVAPEHIRVERCIMWEGA